jgi:argonaute-like protein implicated in RNA metabolism and viral defense
MCGREEQLKVNYTFSETGQNAGVSVLTGRAAAHKATITTSKSYSAQMHPVFEAKIFSELKNAQSIVLAYDGLNPLPPSYCYLKPYYIDPNISYFEQLAQGLI